MREWDEARADARAEAARIEATAALLAAADNCLDAGMRPDDVVVLLYRWAREKGDA